MKPFAVSNSQPEIDPIQLRPTAVHVDLNALADNYRTIAALVQPAKVMPIVKSNAYGHGIVECSRCLEELGAAALGVAIVEEGIQLRRAGIKTPIVVLGGIFGNQISYFLENDLDLTASSVFKLRAIEEQAKLLKKRARVHLKVDTGLERIGVHYYNAETLLKAAQECRNCDIVALFSHFATQDSPDTTFMKLQFERFMKVAEQFEAGGLKIAQRHIAGSGALLSFPESRLEIVRPGACLYGICPAPHLAGAMKFKPVLSLRSQVVYFKVVKANAGVSYGHTWKASTDTRVVTVPVGYGDGYRRQLSNCGEVLIHGKRYPIIGRIGMDQLMVNIGPNGEAYNGDEVVLIGKQGGEEISTEQIAELMDADVREVLVTLNSRLPRKYSYSA